MSYNFKAKRYSCEFLQTPQNQSEPKHFGAFEEIEHNEKNTSDETQHDCRSDMTTVYTVF